MVAFAFSFENKAAIAAFAFASDKGPAVLAKRVAYLNADILALACDFALNAIDSVSLAPNAVAP